MVIARLPFMVTNRNPTTRPTTIASTDKGGGFNQQNEFTHTKRIVSVARGKLGRKVRIVTI